jgi:uracil phosphoribosyltransferase
VADEAGSGTNSPKFLVCDPMIGSGNAMIGALEGLKVRLGDTYIEQNVHVLGLFVTAEAAVRISARYPKVSLHAATIDNHLNELGWVIADDSSQFLGDFGDCYTAGRLTPEKLTDLLARGVLDEAGLHALQKRLGE